MERLCRVLLSQAQRYGRDRDDAEATELAATSLSLLVLLNTRRQALDERRIFDTSTLQCMLSSLFPNTGSRLPSQSKDESIGRAASNLLADMAFAKGEGYAALSNHVAGALDRAWPMVLSQRIEGLENALLGVLSLHCSSRASVRQSLKNFLDLDNTDEMLTDDDTPVTVNMRNADTSSRAKASRLMVSLLLLARHDCFAVASLSLALLRTMMEQPQSHDNLSRALWASFEQQYRACWDEANKFIQNTISLLRYVASSDHAASVIETLPDHLTSGTRKSDWNGKNTIFVRFEPRLCSTLDGMQHLSKSNVLICTLRASIGNDTDHSAENVASLLIPRHESSNRSGILRAISLSGATILGQGIQRDPNGLVDQTASEMRRVLRRSLTSEAGVLDTIGESLSDGSSCDLTSRALGLQQIIGEEFGMSSAASVYSFCSRTKSNAIRSKENALEASRHLGQMTEKVQSLKSTQLALQQNIDNLRASHSQAIARTKAAAEANAMDTHDLLAEEKARAEELAQKCQNRTVQAEEKCREANAREESARTSLEEAKASLSELSQRFETLEIQLQDEVEGKAAAKEELHELRKDLQAMENDLDEKADDLADVEKERNSVRQSLHLAQDANSELREEMENAYGRLVSLAQIFQVKEEDLEKANSNHRDANRRAHREADELAKKRAVAEERASAFENENKELKKKLARAMKELEKEKSVKAKGPVGYFNKLHNEYESKHERGDRDRDHDRDRDRYRDRSERYGKENERKSSRARASSRNRDDSQRRFRIER